MKSQKRTTLRQRNVRITRTIGWIVLGVVPASATSQACGSSASDGASAVDASTFDTSAGDAPSDSPPEASGSDSAFDSAACAITAQYVDAGRTFDAEGGGIDLSCVYDLPCGLPASLVTAGCDTFIGERDGSPDAWVPTSCTITEGSGCTDGSVTPGPNGHLSMTCLDCLGGGRRPRGLRRPSVHASSILGGYFARMAHEEAASIRAFVRLESELASFGAPIPLRRAARRARQDEIVHAQVMAKQASRAGARCAPPRIARFRERSLEAMAMENAVEGCVNELFGAVLLTWQAQHVPGANLNLKLMFGALARDEARHAGLAWSVFDWTLERLAPPARARLRRAQRKAIATLRRAAPKTARLVDVPLGMPSLVQRLQLIDRMAAALALDELPQ